MHGLLLPADRRPCGRLVLLHPVAQFLDDGAIVPLDASLRFGVARFPMHHHKVRPHLLDLGDDVTHELRLRGGGGGECSGASEGVEYNVACTSSVRATFDALLTFFPKALNSPPLSQERIPGGPRVAHMSSKASATAYAFLLVSAALSPNLVPSSL